MISAVYRSEFTLSLKMTFLAIVCAVFFQKAKSSTNGKSYNVGPNGGYVDSNSLDLAFLLGIFTTEIVTSLF